jgi:CHAD domain-containing protein
MASGLFNPHPLVIAGPSIIGSAKPNAYDNRGIRFRRGRHYNRARQQTNRYAFDQHRLNLCEFHNNLLLTSDQTPSPGTGCAQLLQAGSVLSAPELQKVHTMIPLDSLEEATAMPQPVTAFLRQSLALKAAIVDCLDSPSMKPVHRLRSSTRRLEATLELLDLSTDVKVRRKSKPLRKALREIRRGAGAVRDLDVHRNLLKAYKKNNDTDKLDHDLVSAREKAAHQLTSELRKDQKQLNQELNELETILKPVLDLDLSGAELISLTRKWFASTISHLDPQQDDQLHAIRKAGKTARYIAETGAKDSKAVAGLAARFEHAQNTLGAWHDCLLLLDEAQESLPEHSPTTEQLQEKAVHLRQQANATAKHLLATFCAQKNQR